jgi:hypothetical protein
VIFGNPSKFAIQMDVVEEWSAPPSFVEGIVNVYINDALLNNDFVWTSSIYQDYLDIVDGALSNPPDVDEEIFSANAATVLPAILKARYPWYVFDSEFEYESKPDEWWDAADEDLSKDATFETLKKFRQDLYVIKFKEMVRLFVLKFELNESDYFDLSKFNYATVSETIVDVGYVKCLVRGICDWHEKMMKEYIG